MKELPLVSVIIPCYNHEIYIEECIESIFNQTYKNIEVIVIDDLSTDNSVMEIKKLKDKYDFLFIEHEYNQGLSKTYNIRLKAKIIKIEPYLASCKNFTASQLCAKIRINIIGVVKVIEIQVVVLQILLS